MHYQICEKVSDKYGDSFYIFKRKKLKSNFYEMSSAFQRIYPNTVFGYSFKTNYTPAICMDLLKLGCYSEVVSPMEVDLALRLNKGSSKIIFNGPCKTYESIKLVINAGGIINLDSLYDFELVEEVISKENIENARLGLRCNFSLKKSDSSNYSESRFGMDVEGKEFHKMIFDISKNKKMSLSSLHCHMPFRTIHSFEERVRNMLDLVDRYGLEKIEFLNFGGGMYGPMPKELADSLDKEIPSYEDYANVIGNAMVEKFGRDGPGIILEPGTALVADVFDFCTKVISTKRIGSKNIAIVSGSIFDFATNSRSTKLPFDLIQESNNKKDNPKEKWKIVGYTCIESDVLTEQFHGNVNTGDFIKYKNTGSYSIVMRPPFIKPSFAIVEIVDEEIKCIKHPQQFDSVFKDFNFDS